jgi:hypothetical protein
MVNRGSRHERSSNHGTEEALAMSGRVTEIAELAKILGIID